MPTEVKSPGEVVYDSIAALMSKGLSLADACSRLGLSVAAACALCGKDEADFATLSERSEATKSDKLLNTALTLRKAGMGDRSICNSLGINERQLVACGLPLRSLAGLILTKVAARTGTRSTVNKNFEQAIRTDRIPKRGVCKNANIGPAQAAYGTGHPASPESKAIGMRDRTCTNTSVDWAGSIDRKEDPKRAIPQNRNLKASVVFNAPTGDGSGYRDILDAADADKAAKDKIRKSIFLKNDSKYSWSDLVRHSTSAIEGIEQRVSSGRDSFEKAAERILSGLPNEIAGFAAKVMKAEGKQIPSSLIYLLS